MIKILTIIGARPQFIKAAAISRAIQNNYSGQLQEIIVHTGQHYDPLMSEVFFEELNIPREDYNLNVGSGSHALQTSEMMIGLEKVILRESPDAVLMYGDTNSTLAGALVAAKMHLPIIHVEAGVRSYNKDFPEEVNRLICDHLSCMLFVPTIAGINALKNEGITDHSQATGKADYNHPAVYHCGDVMYDNTLYFSGNIAEKYSKYFENKGVPEKGYILATIHRPSNTDERADLENVMDALVEIGRKHAKHIVLPLHPRTLKQMKNFGIHEKYASEPNMHLVDPASFLEMIVLQKNCDLVITDSGGVQKEAFFMKKPCIILLEETPWVELVETENSILAGNDYEKIINSADTLLNHKSARNFPEIYGDGKASEFICEEIIKRFNK